MTAGADGPDDGPVRPGGSPEGTGVERQPEPGGALGGTGPPPDDSTAPTGRSTGFGFGFRVVVDRDLCQGHGVCEAEAAAVFSVSKKGELTVLDDTPPDDQRSAVEAAVKYCPTHALSIQED